MIIKEIGHSTIVMNTGELAYVTEAADDIMRMIDAKLRESDEEDARRKNKFTSASNYDKNEEDCVFAKRNQPRR